MRDMGSGPRVRIGERVRAAHLSHYCPGGLGFPVASPSSAGLDLEHAHFIRQSWLIVADHAARAAGRTCARCGQPMAADQNARRRITGDWVHESCPALVRDDSRGGGQRGTEAGESSAWSLAVAAATNSEPVTSSG